MKVLTKLVRNRSWMTKLHKRWLRFKLARLERKINMDQFDEGLSGRIDGVRMALEEARK